MKCAPISGKAWHRIAAPTAALLLAPVALTATSPAGAGRLIAAMADPLAVLAGRSPGARPAGALTQSKQRRPTAHKPRSERLPRVRRAATGIPPEGYAPGDAIPFGEIVPQAVTSSTPIAFQAPVGGGVGSFSGGGFGGIGGGSGTGGGGGGNTTPNAPMTPTAAVPEPATWASLLLGMMVIGIALRRRRSTAPIVA